MVWTKPATEFQVSKKGKTEGEIDKMPPYGQSILHFAVQNKMSKVVSALLDRGGEEVAHLLSHTDSHRSSPLHYACYEASSERADILALLLGACRGQQTNPRDRRQRTPLHIAANAITATADVSTESMEHLLAAGADTAAVDLRGRTPLHYLFVKIGAHNSIDYADPIAALSILLKRCPSGAVDRKDQWGNSPLHYASQHGANICLLSLLRTKPTIDARNVAGNSPLAISVLHKHKASALTLLQASADIRLSIHKPLECVWTSEEKYREAMQWVWSPARPAFPEPAVLAIPDGVVEAEWQGVVYVILEQMGGDAAAVFSLIKAAIQFRKYNLVSGLLRGARVVFAARALPQLLAEHDDENNLFRVLAEFGPSGDGDGMQLKVAEMLQQFGVKWCDGSGTSSRPTTLAAENGNFNLLGFFENQHPRGVKGQCP